MDWRQREIVLSVLYKALRAYQERAKDQASGVTVGRLTVDLSAAYIAVEGAMERLGERAQVSQPPA